MLGGPGGNSNVNIYSSIWLCSFQRATKQWDILPISPTIVVNWWWDRISITGHDFPDKKAPCYHLGE
ncbi:unnamed protein product [Blepharisma stoltei]|uniref:Uncharacterized protein n=1 Tax=Blepharisma stoltei TaxID=1481888 RepID=A0AAU9JGZ4_9CILI|nr:unnamed protein product [Blepharisma stoltei]